MSESVGCQAACGKSLDGVAYGGRWCYSTAEGVCDMRSG